MSWFDDRRTATTRISGTAPAHPASTPLPTAPGRRDAPPGGIGAPTPDYSKDPQGGVTGMTPEQMFLASMQKHGLDPIGVQKNGRLMLEALKADYPNLAVTLDPKTDALFWPGIGSLDVTIDSGKGGWAFRADGYVNGDGTPGPGAGGAGGSGGERGAMLTPWTEAFTPRDAAHIADDPAYQFQLKEGLQGVERGAASKGTLLTGGTLKAVEQYGQGLASTYNDKYYARDRSEYDLRRENFYNNQDRPFDKLFKSSELGKPAA